MINISDYDFLELISSEKVDEVKNILQSNGKVIELWNFIEENDYTILHKITYKTKKSDGLLETVIDYAKMNIDETQFKRFINARTIQGFTSLHYASYRGDIDTIKLLIDHGADYTSMTNKKLTMIHMAVQGNQPSSLCYFKDKYHMDIDSCDSVKSTPLHWGCYLGSEIAVKYLLSWDVNCNAQDHEGLTPLHLTILSQKKKIAKQLLHKGADKNIKNNKGETPYDFAVEKRIQVMVDMLQELKCKKCRLKVPLEKIEKSIKNIIIFILVHLLIIYSTFWLFFQVYDTNKIIEYTYYGIIFIEFFLFILLICSNPGRLKLDNNNQTTLLSLVESKINIANYCPTCIIPIKSQSRHCFICNECIDKFDHHCYWINNCIGKRNFFYFLLFLLWTNAEVIYNMFIQINTLILLKNIKTVITIKCFPYFCAQGFTINKIYLIGLCVICFIICFAFSLPLLILLGLNGMNMLSLCKCKLRRKAIHSIRNTIQNTSLVATFQNSFGDA